MINKDTIVKVINKYNGLVVYAIEELGINRTYHPGEIKDVTFEELQRLSYTPGGEVLLKEYLEVHNKEAVEALFTNAPEIEYYYSKEDVKRILTEGSLDEFLDCLDFAPAAIKEEIKDLAVELPLNDIEKRQAILDKLHFNVTKAIEVKNAKYDGGDEVEEKKSQTRRRVAPPAPKKETSTTRRVNTTKS